jgi:hypothetical protein
VISVKALLQAELALLDMITKRLEDDAAVRKAAEIRRSQTTITSVIGEVIETPTAAAVTAKESLITRYSKNSFVKLNVLLYPCPKRSELCILV